MAKLKSASFIAAIALTLLGGRLYADNPPHELKTCTRYKAHLGARFNDATKVKELIEKRSYSDVAELLANGAVCPESIGFSLESTLEPTPYDPDWRYSLEGGVAGLLVHAHRAGEDAECLQIIDGFGSSISDDAVQRFTLYCHAGCSRNAGKNCRKAAMTLEEMALKPASAACTCQGSFEHSEKVIALKEQKKFRDVFKLLAMQVLCDDALEAVGIKPRQWHPLEDGLDILVSEAHHSGLDDQCLHMIDEYLKSRPRPRPLSDKNWEDEVTHALQVYTRTCYAACAKHGGPNCEAAAKALKAK